MRRWLLLSALLALTALACISLSPLPPATPAFSQVQCTRPVCQLLLTLTAHAAGQITLNLFAYDSQTFRRLDSVPLTITVTTP